MPQNVDDFFWCLHDPSLVTWDPFRCSETVFYNFHVFYWNRSSNWATWVDDSSGRWIWPDFWKMTHEVTYQSVYGYGKSWPEMEFFLIDSFSHQILGFRHGFRLEWMFPIEWDGFLIIWTSHQTPEVFRYNHVPVEKKIKLSSKNIMKINMDVFWSTTINFRTIRWHEGSIYASGTPFDHSESTKDPVCVRKSSQSKASELKTARENLFLSTQRDSVDENRSKNAPSGQNND